MTNRTDQTTLIVTCVEAKAQRARASLLVDSIRSFGGALAQSPVLVFDSSPEETPLMDIDDENSKVVRLLVPDRLAGYPLAEKVCACARAEESAEESIHSLVWLAPECLVVNEPALLDLGDAFDVALRPVHIRNVGLDVTSPIDDYWQRIFDDVGIEDIEATVESFVDGHHIRGYYNTHVFSTRPSEELFRRWLEHFDALVADQEFQHGPCGDEIHQVFLHQAVLSALVSAAVEPARRRALPPTYSYPFNLQGSIPGDRRAPALNDLVCAVYEDRSVDPRTMTDIAVEEPLRSWLSARANRPDAP